MPESLTSEERNALVVEGGAMRGIFSAGASNLAAYLAGMPGRNHRVYTDYSVRSAFINWGKFLSGGHLIDLDWLWGITIREVRLDLDRILASGKRFVIGSTRVDTGEAVYLEPSRDNLEEALKASSALPLLYRKFVRIDGMDLADGGLTDPIPVLEAARRNARNIMVIRSRPCSYAMKPDRSGWFAGIGLRNHPHLVRAMRDRHLVYRRAVDFLRRPPEGIRVLEVNPPEEFRVGRLTTDREVLEEGYRQGWEAGLWAMEEWNGAK